MTKRSVYIVAPDMMYIKMFTGRGWVITNNIADADLIQFTGGEDVSPYLYGESMHPATYNNVHRDLEEKAIYQRAEDMAIPMAGICRGGQFLNVMNGGSMWQDVDKHGGRHDAYILGGLIPVKVSSTHHQMMRPSEDGMVLMTAGLSTYKEAMDGNTKFRRIMKEPITTRDDVEAVFYPETNSLCFQPHPEYGGYAECQDVYFKFIEEYCFGEMDVLEYHQQDNGTVIVTGDLVHDNTTNQRNADDTSRFDYSVLE